MAEKVIYLFDETSKEFQGSNLVEDDHTLTTGETEIAPEQGLYQPATFDGTKWNGTDKAVWQATQDAAYQAYLKEHPELAPHPSSEQQQLAELIKSNTSQSVLNAQLIKQVATLQTQTHTTQEAK